MKNFLIVFLQKTLAKPVFFELTEYPSQIQFPVSSDITSYKNTPTQRRLAKDLGVSDAYISMLLSGKRHNPKTLDTLKKLINSYVKVI